MFFLNILHVLLNRFWVTWHSTVYWKQNSHAVTNRIKQNWYLYHTWPGLSLAMRILSSLPSWTGRMSPSLNCTGNKKQVMTLWYVSDRNYSYIIIMADNQHSQVIGYKLNRHELLGLVKQNKNKVSLWKTVSLVGLSEVKGQCHKVVTVYIAWKCLTRNMHTKYENYILHRSKVTARLKLEERGRQTDGFDCGT